MPTSTDTPVVMSHFLVNGGYGGGLTGLEGFGLSNNTDNWGGWDNGGENSPFGGSFVSPPPQVYSPEEMTNNTIAAAIAKENAKRRASGQRDISPILDGDLYTKITQDAIKASFGTNTSNNPNVPTTTTSGNGSSSWITPSSVGGLASITAAIIASQNAGNARNSSNGQVDINALDAYARKIAQQNALESKALEEMLTPEVPALRTAANNAVLNGIGPSPTDAYTNDKLHGLVNNPIQNGRSPLLQAAIEKAKGDLAMGGRLSPETQNQVTRLGLARAGTVAPGGLGLGRDVVARDLGLSSLQLEQQRLQNASTIGQQELVSNQFDTNTGFNNNTSLLNAINLLNQSQNSQFSRNMAGAQYGNSIQPPMVGLDPSAVVNLSVGNSNAASANAASRANIYGAQSQNLFGLGGQLFGSALLNYNNSQKTPGT